MKKKIIWIDDQSERAPNAENLKHSLSANVDFYSVEGKSIDETLNEILTQEEPDLVILDHSLDRAISSTYQKGSTAATFIRETWEKCPIVSCTHMDVDNIPIRSLAAYDQVYELSKISREYVSISSLIQGFNYLRSAKIIGIETFIDSLGSSESDSEKILKIIPNELKEHSTNSSSISLWYRWCRDFLFSRPGFLYNELWTATLLGLSQEGFEKVKSKFERAQYKGVFSRDDKELWWKSIVLEILAQETGLIGLSWISGRELIEGGSDSDYSKCYSSDEPFPETVGAIDDTPKAEWHPMKLMFTELHPNYESLVFFDDLRIMSIPEE